MARRIPLPTVSQYVTAILEAEGPFTVCGTYYGTGNDAEVQRNRTAMRWAASDARRAARIRRMVAEA